MSAAQDTGWILAGLLAGHWPDYWRQSVLSAISATSSARGIRRRQSRAKHRPAKFGSRRHYIGRFAFHEAAGACDPAAG